MAAGINVRRLLVVAAILSVNLPDRAVADTLLCFKKFQKVSSSSKGSRVRHSKLFRVVQSDSCPRGYLPLVDTSEFLGPQGEEGPQGLQGAQGPQGNQGTDGVLGIYGDGSAGSPTIIDAAALVPNLQYEDFTIDNGVSVTADSGLVIRATGTCTINGTITVSTAALGGYVAIRDTTEGDSNPSIAMPHPGNSPGAPAIGDSGPETDVLFGGQNGLGHTEASARALLRPGIFGGGGGAGGTNNNPNNNTRAGSGGGTITLLCREGIVVDGTILARGGASASVGGGGGGIIILATPGTITMTGFLSVTGGNGSAAETVTAAGGGGGGFIHYIYGTDLTNSGTNQVFGGTAGSQVAAMTLAFRTAGGGGGAGYGNGGKGGNLGSNAVVSSNALSGSAGAVLTTAADPTALFF